MADSMQQRRNAEGENEMKKENAGSFWKDGYTPFPEDENWDLCESYSHATMGKALAFAAKQEIENHSPLDRNYLPGLRLAMNILIEIVKAKGKSPHA